MEEKEDMIISSDLKKASDGSSDNEEECDTRWEWMESGGHVEDFKLCSISKASDKSL